MEIFKEIDGYEGYYLISNYGNVISKRMGFKKMNPGCDTNGYPQVILFKNGKQKCIKISRLVATYFIENPDKLSDVNHIDMDKKNNHFSNLEWVSKRENAAHRNYHSKLSGKSKLLGAVWNSKNNKWCSEIKYNGKRYWLGFFKTDYDAHIAYVNKMNELGIKNKYATLQYHQ